MSDLDYALDTIKRSHSYLDAYRNLSIAYRILVDQEARRQGQTTEDFLMHLEAAQANQ